MYKCLIRPEDVGSLEAELTSVCELPSVGAGNRTMVFYKSSKHYQLLSYGSSQEFNLKKFCFIYY